MSPPRTAPFGLNSQTVASGPPDIRHLPTTLEFPQPAMMHSKTAKPITKKLDFDRNNRTGMELRTRFCSQRFLWARKKSEAYFSAESCFDSFASFAARLDSP